MDFVSQNEPRPVGPRVIPTIAALGGGAINSPEDFDAYFEGVARARYIVRRTFRIFDETARMDGLEPLHHQALIQIVGGAVSEGPLQVNRIAERLDVSSAFASRLVLQLEDKQLVLRRRSDVDGRVILVEATDTGRQCLSRVSVQVRERVAHFQAHLCEEDRAAALAAMAFYVGVPLVGGAVESLVELVQSAVAVNQGSPE